MKNTFRQAVQSGIFTISAELTLDSGSRADDVRRQAGLPGPLVDGIQVNDNPPAWAQMSALAAALKFERSFVDILFR